jgi:hypothetical protein
VADPEPLILYNPDLSINGQTLKCLMSHIELTPDVSTVEVKTSCGVKEYPGTVKWTLKASLYHSFDPLGTNAILDGAVATKAPVPFSVLPKSTTPVSATNPLFTGNVIPQPFTPLSGDVGDASSFDLEWSIAGWTDTPIKSTVAPAAAGATAGIPGYFTPSGCTPPATAAAATSAAIVANPATAWTTGQYVQGSTAGATGEMYWNGTAWTVGRKP